MQMTPEEHRRKLQLCAEYERMVQQIRSERAEAVSALGQVGDGGGGWVRAWVGWRGGGRGMQRAAELQDGH